MCLSIVTKYLYFVISHEIKITSSLCSSYRGLTRGHQVVIIPCTNHISMFYASISYRKCVQLSSVEYCGILSVCVCVRAWSQVWSEFSMGKWENSSVLSAAESNVCLCQALITKHPPAQNGKMLIDTCVWLFRLCIQGQETYLSLCTWLHNKWVLNGL